MTTWKFDDRDPVSERIHEHIENSAAVKMMQQGDKKSPYEKPPTELKLTAVRWVVVISFIVLYLMCCIFATMCVASEFEHRYERNLEYVVKHLSNASDTMELDNGLLNSIYYLPEIKEEHQQFAAAIYEIESGKQMLLTEPYLCFEVEDRFYYFPWSDYFNEDEQKKLSIWGAVGFDVVYMIKADIDVENETLLRFELVRPASHTNGGETVWKWENKEDKAEKYESVSVKGKVSKVVSNPYYNNANLYEKWIEDEYLHGFAEKINPENMTEDTTQKVVGIVKEGKTKYDLVVRTSASPLKAAMDCMQPLYFVGSALVLAGICVIVFSFRRVKKKGGEAVEE